MTTYTQTVNYTPSTENFSNPERGWYKYSKAQSTTSFSFLSQSSLNSYRNTDKITLMLRIYDLGAFLTTPISQEFLNNIQTDFNTLRVSGFKCVLRFRYSETDNIDAAKPILLNHIEQLKSVTIPNQDVIHVLEAGFIGKYGEWYYTSNYGDSGVLSAQNLADRKEIGLKIMELTPNRLVMFRTPKFQQLVGGTTPISLPTSYDGSTNSRVALHNDAFLSSNSDSGTFSNTTTDYTYLDAQSKYTMCGGESNALFPTKQDCPVVFGWLTRFHYNYLNFGYHPDVIALWKTNGCYDEIQRRLGYRFELISSTIENGIITVNIRNVGFSNVFNPRKVYLVYKNTSTNILYSFEVNTDIRRWNAGETTQFSKTIETTLPDGIYNLYLNIPDENGNFLHSIQLANTGVWDSSKGYNNLNQSITIEAAITNPPPVDPPPPVLTVTIYVENNIIKVTNLTNYTIAVYNSSNKLVSTTNDMTRLKRGWYTIKVTDTSTGKVYTLKYYKK